MDEDYARKLRAWLRAEPAARKASEERQWLREVPDPGPAVDGEAGGWRPVGGVPWSGPPVDAEAGTDEDWTYPVVALPVPRASRENGCRMSQAEARSRWNHPANWRRRQAEVRATAEHRHTPEDLHHPEPQHQAEHRRDADDRPGSR